MDDGSIHVRLSGAELPNGLVSQKEFQALRARNNQVAETLLAMSDNARDAVEHILNRMGGGWTLLLDVEDLEALKTAANALASNTHGSPAYADAAKALRALADS